MAPVADAVGLVDGEGVDADLLQQRGRSRSGTSRSGETNSRRTAPWRRSISVGEALAAGQGAVDLGGGDAAGPQAVHLVLHQGDERRDDDGGAAAEHGGGLVAERLAAAGGQDDERIAAVEDGRIASSCKGPTPDFIALPNAWPPS